ncbi:ATP-binding protein [Staphylococcus canis]|uniref:AAA family ATPase n=1 Tax=Staphylococcus canis TaxID=2724942 RepID=A0ABS0TBJ7_9STAP|nr:AAA family ATPase [Staphylococcus canis]MBI5975787.1 AAA family ATPase [Staphylococcus canis]
MKIKSVEIYGYGQFVERKVEFNSFFTEIYGENEAGKSTLQAFIHSILFGFPTQDEHEPRLEPRLGNHYGGRVTLIMDDESEVIVERVKGSPEGDVKVILPNGSVKDEAWLKEHLNYIDKQTYQAIFSFNVLGLQNIHKHLTEQQLQNFLMQAGALGSTEFIGMRDFIQSKKQDLYQQNNQTSEINRRVDELKEIELQIRDKSSELETYQRVLETRDKTQNRLDTVNENLNHLNQFHSLKQKELALHEQAQEWKGLESDLNIEPITFPHHGIDRYEAAKLQHSQLQKDLGLKEEKINQLEQENQKFEIPSQKDFKKIEELYKQEEKIKEDTLNLKHIRRDIDQHQHDLDNLLQKVGWESLYDDVDTSEVQVSHVSRSLNVLKDQTSKYQRLKQKVEEYDIETNSYQKELNQLEERLVSEQDFEQKQVHEKQMLELNEKRQVFSNMKEMFEKEADDKKRRKVTLRIILILVSLLSIGSAIFAFLTNNLIFSIIFAVLAIIFIGAIFLTRQKERNYNQRLEDEIDALEKHVKQLEENYHLDFNLNDQLQLRNRVSERKQSLNVLELKHQNAIQQLKQVESELKQSHQQINDIKSNLHVSQSLSNDLLVNAYRIAQQIQENASYINQLKQKEHMISSQLNVFYEEAEKEMHRIIGLFQIDTLFHDMNTWLKRVASEKSQFENNTAQIDLLQNEMKQLDIRLNEVNTMIKELFSTVGAIDEESYYNHYERYQTYQSRLSRFNDLTKYLENQDFGYEKSSHLSSKTTAQLETEFEKLSQQIDTYNDQFLELQAEVSELTAQINHMESDDTLRQLQHRYQLKRRQLNDIAKDWAALSYLEALVDEHIKQIKDKRLPQVVEEATVIYQELTEGQYEQVTFINHQLMVRHKNGQMYHPIELSQSTKELLYIALRLSLIKILKPYYALPIIIDDAFVHFDTKRKTKMLKYLRAMSDDDQVLYFTCNRDNIVSAKQLVTLSKIEK